MSEHNNLFSGSGKFALYAVAGAGLLAAARSIYRNMTRYDFRDQVVVITGGSRGLGLLIARELAAKGAHLVICSRTTAQLEKAEEALNALGANVLTVRADISVQQDAQKVIDAAVSHFGKVDVLINNAGTMTVGPQDVMDIEDFKNAMDINFWGGLYMIKAALPYFTEQQAGRIANICSIGGKISVPHLLPYSVSKFAMVGLSEGLHAELKKDNIHVTTVIPNLMQTGSPRNISVKGDHEAEYAWFKTAGSSSLLSQNAKKSAREIVEAIEFGENELILTATGKLSVALQGVNPGLISALSAAANKFLPTGADNSQGNAFETKKGYESESEKSIGIVNAKTDKAAIENNEL